MFTKNKLSLLQLQSHLLTSNFSIDKLKVHGYYTLLYDCLVKIHEQPTAQGTTVGTKPTTTV